MQDDVRQFGFVVGEEELQGELLLGFEFGLPFIFALPIEEAALLPVGEVVEGKVFAVLAEFFANGATGEAILHHEADGIAKVVGEAGDFAVAGAPGFAALLGRLCFFG